MQQNLQFVNTINNPVPFTFANNQLWLLPNNLQQNTQPRFFTPSNNNTSTNIIFTNRLQQLNAGQKRKWESTTEYQDFFTQFVPIKRRAGIEENKIAEINTIVNNINNTTILTT